jgi:hypothetical protein
MRAPDGHNPISLPRYPEELARNFQAGPAKIEIGRFSLTAVKFSG